MKIISAGRAAGKTYHMLQWIAARPHALLVTFDSERAYQLRDEFRILFPEGYEKAEDRILSIEEARAEVRRRNTFTEIGIDDLDMFFASIFRAPVTLATQLLPVDTEQWPNIENSFTPPCPCERSGCDHG